MFRDPFDGLPLKAWAEKLGERVMPAYELIKEEQAAAKRAAKVLGKQVKEQLSVPSIPHVLPFTRWCMLLSACPRHYAGLSLATALYQLPVHVGSSWPLHACRWECLLPAAPAEMLRGIRLEEESVQQLVRAAEHTYLVAERGLLCRAANSKVIQNTFVAGEGKERKKARLSWYHPDDTVSTPPQPMLPAPAADVSGRKVSLLDGCWCSLVFGLRCATSVMRCGAPSVSRSPTPSPGLISSPDAYADGAKRLVQRGPAQGPGLLQALQQHLNTIAQLCRVYQHATCT